MARAPLSPKSYLQFNFNYLTFSGLWNPYNDHRKWLYMIYCTVMVFSIEIIRIHGYMIHAWSVHYDFERFTLSAFLALAFTCGCIKNINLLWHRSDIKFLATALMWERGRPCSKETAIYRDKIIPEVIKQSNLFAMIWILDALFCGLFFYSECWNEHRRTLDHILIGYTCLRRIVERWNFWILLVIDYLMFTIMSFTVLANDCLVMSLTFHLSTQLKILNFRLRKCFKSYRDSACNEISANVESNDLHFSQIDVEQLHSTPNQELIYCTQHYQLIVQMVEVMQKVYGIILFPQLASSAIMISLTGIHLFVTKTASIGHPVLAGQIILALLSIMFQLVVYCWGGSMIICESELISSAAYKSKWYQGDREFQRNMQIFSAMTRKPLYLSAFGVFQLSLPTLKNVIIKSYSAMALLKRANE
ncbi:uncharacterized protein LOC135167151 isoform X2 [Diachasmimorpha longicaudata]|uniref:uncharacterized protein LOC135167151 isoform X2 n=1 Tax=Diachasmimorpha longicaudata TaxID=58733 RepID=UPI0030B86F94